MIKEISNVSRIIGFTITVQEYIRLFFPPVNLVSCVLSSTMFGGVKKHGEFIISCIIIHIQTHGGHSVKRYHQAAHLPGSLSVPPIGLQLLRQHELQWSLSYHKHFFNSTFNLPGLKTPQTTIWHQPQLLHCRGTESGNMILTVNF